jgi:hypothetical protein
MNGHDITAWLDPETGWQECRCGKFTEPVEGEPYDEYSAACAVLTETYYNELVRSLPMRSTSQSYLEIQNANVRTKLATLLAGATPQHIEALISSLRNSQHGFERHSDIMRLESCDMPLFTMLGVHLDGNARYLLETALVAVNNVAAPTELPDGKRWNRLGTAVEANLNLACVTAKLLDMLEIDTMPKGNAKDQYRLHDSLAAVCPPLESRTELLPVIAALYNDRGYSEEATEHMLSLIASGVTPHLALADGLI